MNCKQAQKQIHLYLDEQLSPSAADKLSGHISICEGCRQELTFWRNLTSAIQTGSLQKEPDDYTEDLMTSLPDQIPEPHRYGYIAFAAGLLFAATTIFCLAWFFSNAIAAFALSSAAFLEDVILSSISSFSQWFKHGAKNTDGFFDKIDNFRLWYLAFWVIIVCGIATAAMQIIAIAEISMRWKR